MRFRLEKASDITGFAACNVPKDHYGWVLSSSRLTSDDSIFYKYIEEISKTYLYATYYKIGAQFDMQFSDTHTPELKC